ncbi:NRDE family protein [Gracilimonas mengyeensis]|uniref:Uncharacterized conserved protein, contains NRDE domain n=1 Tax=Gracilimonas mengyeensis TaxID=1302730 RepID=A0A521F9A9_9BACT|nr:NRDE family protein [Gracilimonas mengyeensis]SMO92707.1 Uncharacterized conserved protein, contains NRDE domain [Gracilimonas mengyeensis]
MCLITFANNAHPKYQLVFAGNRDEFYERPTRKAQFWTEEGHPNILAGKDIQGGGTWLGVHKDGRWATLTNYRDLSDIKEDAPTRGDLPLEFLKNSRSAVDYLDELKQTAHQYNGFNLLLSDESGIFHFSNQDNKITEVAPGVHGLSNALLDTSWPKTERAKAGLTKVLQHEEMDKEALFSLLTDEMKAPDSELPETGLSQKMERLVSSIFIKSEDYGTRCSTVFLIDRDGNIDFTERTFEPGSTSVKEEQHFSFNG